MTNIETAKPKRGRGRPPSATPKVLVSVRIDHEVAEAIRMDEPGWRGRLNDLLKAVTRLRGMM